MTPERSGFFGMLGKCKVLSNHMIRVPVRVSHAAIDESSKELAKPNLCILAILAKLIHNYFS